MIRIKRRLLVVVLGLGFSVVSAGPADAQVRAGSGIGDQEIAKLAEEIIAAHDAFDVKKMNLFLDWNSIVAKSITSVEAPEKFKQGFSQGLKNSIDAPNGVMGRMVEQAKLGSQMVFLRSRTRDGKRTALFRMTGSDESSGLNYLEFVAARTDQGILRFADIYMYMVGEYLTDTFRRIFTQAAAEQNRGFVGRLMNSEKVYLDGLTKVPEITALSDQGKFAEALAKFDALPAAVRKEKMFMAMRIQLTQKLNDDAYAAAIEEFRKAFPNEVSADLQAIDGYLLKKQHEKAIDSVDRVDKAVDGDPYLNLIRAGIWVEKGDFDKARKSVLAAIESFPDILQYYWSLVEVDLKRGDNLAVLDDLKKIDGHFEMVFSDLKENDAYKSFVKSPEYRQWNEYLKNKKAKPTPASKP